ncbi:MAG TPA: DMT family transporter [Gemmatimonadales bacterium]|nr:DMT family transporter [Gemmatimonadales bacterium]
MPRSAAPSAFALTRQDWAMLVVCLLWGANFSITKLGLQQIPPLGFTAIRFTSASIVLWLVLRWWEGPAPLPPRTIWLLIWLGVLGNTIYQICFMLGLDLTSATHSALIISTVPTVVAVLAGIFRLERITSRMIWGIAIGTIGVVIVVSARGHGVVPGSLTGDLITVGAVLCWSVYTLGLRKVPESVSPLRVTSITMITGTPGLILAGLPDLFRTNWRAVTLAGWGSVAYAALLSLVLAYILWNNSVRVIGSSRTAVYLCITPIFAVIIAWFALGEQPAPIQALGAALIIWGVLLSRR